MKILDVPQSGSVAGVVSSRNRFGQYRRSRATPVNPNTARQGIVRARFADASTAWRTLSSAVRAAWQSYADAHPRTDSLGQTVLLTGAQMFTSQWLALDNAGLAVPPDVPTLELPSAPSVTALAVFGDGDPVDALSFTSDAVLSAAVVLVVEASLPVSAGVSFMADYRFVQSFNAALVAGAVAAGAAYVAKFGFAPIGSRVFVRARIVRATSEPSAWSYANAVSAAT